MKRFLSAVAFCVFLLVFGLIVLLPKASAEKNLLQNLLNLPAAPSSSHSLAAKRKNFSAEFLDKSKPPGDDAPIEELMAYWEGQSSSYRELGYNIKPSEGSLQRILSELETKPEKLVNFLNILPEKSETAEFVKRIYDKQSGSAQPDKDGEDGEDRTDRNEPLKRWLTYHTKYFSDDLLKLANKVGDANEYVTNQDELLALTRVDWEKASPILDRLYNDSRQPVSQTLARWAFYRHALDGDSTSDIEKYRDELKAVVENKSATGGMRDLAFDALVKEKEWSGLDDWYETLLEDETLADIRVNGSSYTGLTTIMYYSPPEKRLARMLKLAESSNPTIRKAAIRNLVFLVDGKNPEVIRVLLPWLENPDWAQEVNGERGRLIYALSTIKIPESVPGLIAVLNEKQTRQMPTAMASNRMASNSMMSGGNLSVMRDDLESRMLAMQSEYAYRSAAVSALATQKDGRAIAPLREILSQVESWQAGNVVRALVASGGFTIPEQVEALEIVAANYSQPREVESLTAANGISEKFASVERESGELTNAMSSTGSMGVGMSNASIASNQSYYAPRPTTQQETKTLLGQQLATQNEADENLVAALIDRIEILRTKNPPMAFGLRRIVMKWRGAAINQMLMRDVKNDRADTDAVVKLLSLRKELRENQSNDIADMRSGSQTAYGISTCLLENPSEYDVVLQSENTEAKAAMLACARLIRAALSVRKVAENLKNPNKTLALAAERYLEAEDSPEAQNFVLARHPNEAKILGAKKLFVPDDAPVSNSIFLPALFASLDDSNYAGYYYEDTSDEFAADEKKLQKEVKENQELIGIYAYDDNYIRIYKDKAVFSWQTDTARYRERDLSKEEFEGFKNYLTGERVNELPPFFSECGEQCQEKELLMLGRNGGRRIYLFGSESPRFFAELAELLERMRQPPAKLRYALEKNLAGLEILYEDDNLQAETVWKNGADLRVLIGDVPRRKQIDKELEKQDAADEEKEDFDYEESWKVRQKRRERRTYENFAWHTVADGKLGEVIAQPTGVEYIQRLDGAAVNAAKGQWKARAATFEIRADADGLYKATGGRVVKIADGYYEKPVITPNGRWAVATKFDGEAGAVLMRVNLTTRKEIPVKIETDYYPRFEPVVYIPSINKVLIFGGSYGEEESESEGESESEDITQKPGEFYLLDAETGAVSKPKGEIRPLAQQTFRPLQTSGKPDEFWAAISDAEREETKVGIYNAKTLAFNSILKIPNIEFGSMRMWVDADKVYFVYQGHLLSLPLPK